MPESTTAGAMRESGDGSAARHAIGRLHAEHYRPLVRLAYLLTGDDSAAEDLVQESFVQLWRRQQQVQEPHAYLRTSVVNGCRSWHRRQLVRRRYQPPAAAALEPDSHELFDVLLRLPYRQRAAIVLRFWLDLTTDQIAVQLGCRPGTARSLLHRGLGSLREELRP